MTLLVLLLLSLTALVVTVVRVVRRDGYGTLPPPRDRWEDPRLPFHPYVMH